MFGDRVWQRIQRDVAPLLDRRDDVRGVILASTIVPNRNWFILVTSDEFIVVRAASWRLRPVAVVDRVERTVLHSRLTLTGRRTVALGSVDYHVSRVQLRAVMSQNADYEAHRANEAARRPAVASPHRGHAVNAADSSARARPRGTAHRGERPTAVVQNSAHRSRQRERSPEYDHELADLRKIVRELRNGLV